MDVNRCCEFNHLTLTLLMWRIWRAPNIASKWRMGFSLAFKGLNAELSPTCHLLAILGAHHILHVSRIRVKMCFCARGATVNQNGEVCHVLRLWKWWVGLDGTGYWTFTLQVVVSIFVSCLLVLLEKCYSGAKTLLGCKNVVRVLKYF